MVTFSRYSLVIGLVAAAVATFSTAHATTSCQHDEGPSYYGYSVDVSDLLTNFGYQDDVVYAMYESPAVHHGSLRDVASRHPFAVVERRSGAAVRSSAVAGWRSGRVSKLSAG